MVQFMHRFELGAMELEYVPAAQPVQNPLFATEDSPFMHSAQDSALVTLHTMRVSRAGDVPVMGAQTHAKYLRECSRWAGTAQKVAACGTKPASVAVDVALRGALQR